MTTTTSLGRVIRFAVLTLALSGLAMTCHGQPVEIPCRKILKGHHGQVDGIVPSADGRLLVTTGWDDGTVRIWDLQSGNQRRLLEQEVVESKIKIWDNVSPKERRLIKEEPMDAVAHSVNGKRRLERTGHANENPPKLLKVRAALLPDSHHIIIILFDIDHSSVCPDEMIVYDLEGGGSETIYSSGKGSDRIESLYNYSVYSAPHVILYQCVRSPQGLSSDEVLNVYDYAKRRVVATIGNEGLSYRHFDLSHDGAMAAVTCHTDLFTPNRRALGGRLTVWNARTGEKIARVQTVGSQVCGSWFSPNGQELAILGGADQNTVYICYLSTYKVTRTLKDFWEKPGQRRVSIGRLVFTPDGHYLTAQGGNGTVLFWETKTYREVLWARLFSSGGVAAVFSPDGKKMMAIGSGKGENDVIKVWDMEQFLSLIPKGPGGIKGVGR